MMQNYFQPARRARAGRRGPSGIALAALVASQALGAETVRSEPWVSAWSTGPKSSMRLIAAASASAPPSSGPLTSAPPSWRVGVEIRLATGALTYWRTPGGAGVAPVFAFTESVNVASAEVRYPAPVRIEEEGTEVYGYHDEVTFPLDVTPRDATRPMKLALTLSFAVCDRICLPARATAVLDLPASPAAAPPEDAHGVAIARAEAAVPRRLSQDESDARVSITAIDGASPPTWRVVVRGEPARDLFAEAADGWYFEIRKADAPGAFLIVQTEKPKAAGDAPVPVTLTLTGPRQPYELVAVLDRETAGR